jgi:hypothetical protein
MMLFHRLIATSLLAVGALHSVHCAQAQNPPTASLPWDSTDLGLFHSGCFKLNVGGNAQTTAKGIAIKVGGAGSEATVLFDTELLRWSGAWTGGFIQFPRGRGGLEGTIKPAGEVVLTSGYVTGWSMGEIADDPRPKHQGNLDRGQAKWRGLYLHGDKVVLSYSVGSAEILELPGAEMRDGKRIFARTLTIQKADKPLRVLLADIPAAKAQVDGLGATLTAGEANGKITITKAAVVGAPQGAKLAVDSKGRLALELPSLSAATTLEVALWAGAVSDEPKTIAATKAPESLVALTKGGASRWGAPLATKGKLSDKDDAYVIDDIPLPDDNPFKSWMRIGGHDFFPDGTCAVANVGGDVWFVDGLDDQLGKVTWKRFATGLFQPLGCKVVDGKIYILGRDQITRLHDLNSDGEADFYENFNNDCVVTDNYHEFALDLQTDSKGDFYYAKGSPWQPTVTSPHQGCMIKVSKDGSKLEVIATGLRAPNGLGMGPKDQLTCSDNQGHWMPANRLNLIKPGGFYGMVPAAQRVLTFKRADGTEFKANPSTDEARAEFKTQFWGAANQPIPTGMDAPMIWLPMNVDNSPGGEVWVPGGASAKWGPLAGQMLHLSYGRCLLYNVLAEEVEGVAQGAVAKLAGKFPSGIMRGRFGPKDGQLYVSGLNVWQSDAAKFGCFSRVRYTGKTVPQPVAIKTSKTGVTISFTAPLDSASAADKENWSVERWNYRWTGAYGSKDYSVAEPNKAGKDLVLIDSIQISEDKKSLTIMLPDMKPADQVKFSYRIKSADGRELSNEIYQTINRVPVVGP